MVGMAIGTPDGAGVPVNQPLLGPCIPRGGDRYPAGLNLVCVPA